MGYKRHPQGEYIKSVDEATREYMRKYVYGCRPQDRGEEDDEEREDEEERDEDDGPPEQTPLSKWELKALEKGELRFDNPRGYIDSTTPPNTRIPFW